MQPYHTLIGVVVEKLTQTYKELKFNYEGLNSVLNSHSPEEISNTPDLITITELRDSYGELIDSLEGRFPGIKN